MCSQRAGLRVSRRALLAVFLVAAVAPGCSGGTGGNGPATPSTARPTAAAEAPDEPERVSGDFEISKMTDSEEAVTVETILVSLESAPTDGAAWTKVAAFCQTTPAPPVRIETSLKIAYDCRPTATVPANWRQRVVVRATIAGSDEAFRIVSEIPR